MRALSMLLFGCLFAVPQHGPQDAGGAKAEIPGAAPRAVAELFEDDAAGLLKELTNPGDGPGKGEPELKAVFSGARSIKISEYQRFHRAVPGWNYAIRKAPAPGQYRYLRFAWRAEGATCLMLQLHDATDWHIRYTAGPNPYGWATRFVADKAPAAWQLVTVDLFADFGERTLTGIAFTTHGGAGYFDHVYLGRTVDDLDRIDADGLAAKKVPLRPGQLEAAWDELLAEDAAVQYRAFWRLVAGGKRSASFIKEKTEEGRLSEQEARQVGRWIADLDADSFATRERASQELRRRAQVARPQLEAALTAGVSTEVRRRLEGLLAAAPGAASDRERREKARRILQYIGPG